MEESLNELHAKIEYALNLIDINISQHGTGGNSASIEIQGSKSHARAFVRVPTILPRVGGNFPRS